MPRTHLPFLFFCIAALLSFQAICEANPYTTKKTFTVTSKESSRLVPGTLNWAVFQANYYGADVNYIEFKIPNPAGDIEILLSEPLYIARLMIVDATTQPGYSGRPLIRLNANGMDSAIILGGNVAGIPPYSDGSPATGGGNPGMHGVGPATAGSTIQGFQIFNYSQNAITIFPEAEGNFIQKNWMGFVSGLGTGVFIHNSTAHRDSRGIGIKSNFNTIRSNTISGVSNGIVIGEDPISTPWSGRNYFTNALENNNIGTDPTGSVVIGNDSDGVFLGGGAAENFIGPNNVISGMKSSGVELLHPSNYGNIIISNLIGVNRAGAAILGNGELGVLIANGGDYNDVGGPSGGNVISGNRLGGVSVGTKEYPAPCTRIYVESNLIGTDATGLRNLGGQVSGITSQNGSEAIIDRNVLVAESNHGIVLNGVGQTTAVRNGRTIKLANAVFGNWIGVSASATPLVFNGPAGPGIQLLNSLSTTNGVRLANQGFGIYVLNSFGNYIQIPAGTENPASHYLRNVFGTNALGNVGFNGCSAADNIYFP